jgi:nitrogen permease regulator 2-like protein
MPEQTHDDASNSFLPRILSVFYAVFDVRQGPKIVYQVPEGLIAVPAGLSAPSSSVPATPSSEAPSSVDSGLSSRGSRTSLASPEPDQLGRSLSSLPSQKPSPVTAHTLFDFHEISKYVIPPPALCGRLVTCSTKRYRIIGFPTELRGKYQRNYFMYNLCFVFDRGADLSCYEPIVRKIARVLTSCEVSQCFSRHCIGSSYMYTGGIRVSLFRRYVPRVACDSGAII